MTPLNLDPRERMGLMLGLLALAVVIGLALYIPAGPKRDYERAQTRLSGLRSDLEMAKLTLLEEEARLQSQQVLKDKLSSRDVDFELLTFLNGLLVEHGLKDRAELGYLRGKNNVPEQPMVDLTLSGVGLKELLDFLHAAFRSGNLIATYKMDTLAPSKSGQGLDCRMTLVTLKV